MKRFDETPRSVVLAAISTVAALAVARARTAQDDAVACDSISPNRTPRAAKSFDTALRQSFSARS